MELLQRETYLRTIQNATGTEMFRSLFARNGGETMDLLDAGRRSCAVFVSSVLYLFDLIGSKRATVEGLERDLLASGWRKVDDPKPGDVIVWEPRLQNGGMNAHVGFYLGKVESCRRAISNDWETGKVVEHDITYGVFPGGEPRRKITAVYTHDFLM